MLAINVSQQNVIQGQSVQKNNKNPRATSQTLQAQLAC